MTVRRTRGITRFLLLFALAAIGTGGGGFALLQYLRPVVTVTETVNGPVVQAFYSTGTIQPVREYPIKSNTAGTLTQVLVDKGDHVTKGQPLAIVTDPSLTFTKDKMQAELNEKLRRADEKSSPVLQEFDARLDGTMGLLEIAQREVKRMGDLMNSNAGAQNDLDRAMDRVKQLMIDIDAIRAQRSAKKLELDREVEVAQSALGIAKWNLDEQTLKAPIDGAVLDRPTPIGTRVAINDPILRIADVTPSRLVMRADVDEEDVAHVNVGQSVRMTLYSFAGQVFPGKVSRIYDQADTARRTFEVEVTLDDPNDRLQPGMTGELAFIVATKPTALVVPSQALQTGAVYEIKDNKLLRREVTVGLRSIERVEILSGLDLGSVVAISPVIDMREGQPVRTRRVDPVVAAGLNRPPPLTEAFKAFGN